MKKIVSLLLVTILAISLFTACTSKGNEDTNSSNSTSGADAEPVTYKDGEYTAEEDEFNNGWKGTVKIVVEDGKITSVDWNALPEDGGDDKDTQSQSGAYGMVEKGGAQAEWHEQAEKVEAYLIETQNPGAIEYDDGGYTDTIAGVSIHVNDFVELAVKALEQAK